MSSQKSPWKEKGVDIRQVVLKAKNPTKKAYRVNICSICKEEIKGLPLFRNNYNRAQGKLCEDCYRGLSK